MPSSLIHSEDQATPAYEVAKSIECAKIQPDSVERGTSKTRNAEKRAVCLFARLNFRIKYLEIQSLIDCLF